MKLLLKMIAILGITAFLSGYFLSFVYSRTISRIEQNRNREIEISIKELIPRGKDYKLRETNGVKIYYVYDDSRKLCGYCLLTSGNGYQGEIKILIGISPQLDKLLGIKILENVETPGLGGKITSPWFLSQFKNLQFKPQIEYVKGKKPHKKNQIEAITGATISSSSVVRIINNTIRRTLPVLEK